MLKYFWVCTGGAGNFTLHIKAIPAKLFRKTCSVGGDIEFRGYRLHFTSTELGAYMKQRYKKPFVMLI